MIEMTKAEWEAEGERRFGPNRMAWKFVCPVCGYVASMNEWRNVGATEGEVAFSCVGRHYPGAQKFFLKTKKGPCDYAGGGLFRLNPISVEGHSVFAFADATEAPKSSSEYPD